MEKERLIEEVKHYISTNWYDTAIDLISQSYKYVLEEYGIVSKEEVEDLLEEYKRICSAEDIEHSIKYIKDYMDSRKYFLKNGYGDFDLILEKDMIKLLNYIEEE